jgi:hypothetical protein
VHQFSHREKQSSSFLGSIFTPSSVGAKEAEITVPEADDPSIAARSYIWADVDPVAVPNVWVLEGDD